jgi:hypothetical protein
MAVYSNKAGLNTGTLGLMFISGCFATMAFDLWGQVVSPGLGFANLSPHGLAKSLFGALGLPNGDFAGYFMHFYLVGLIGYPVGWLFIFKPVWDRVIGKGLPWIVPSAVYGFGLWVFAIRRDHGDCRACRFSSTSPESPGSHWWGMFFTALSWWR